MNKLIYQLIENNVDFATRQFKDNLECNKTVLTNVLYDNIFQLIGSKLEESDFVEQVAQALVDAGAVAKEGDSTPVSKATISEKDYNALLTKIQACVQLLSASRLKIMHLLAEVEESVVQNHKEQEEENEAQSQQRQNAITKLVEQLNGG